MNIIIINIIVNYNLNQFLSDSDYNPESDVENIETTEDDFKIKTKTTKKKTTRKKRSRKRMFKYDRKKLVRIIIIILKNECLKCSKINYLKKLLKM